MTVYEEGLVTGGEEKRKNRKGRKKGRLMDYRPKIPKHGGMKSKGVGSGILRRDLQAGGVEGEDNRKSCCVIMFGKPLHVFEALPEMSRKLERTEGGPWRGKREKSRGGEKKTGTYQDRFTKCLRVRDYF